MSEVQPPPGEDGPPHNHDQIEEASSRTELYLIAATILVLALVVLLIVFVIGPSLFGSPAAPPNPPPR